MIGRVIVKLKELCDLQNGFAFKSKDYIAKSNVMNFRMSQIRPGGKVDLNHGAKYLPENFKEKYNDFILNEGDIVIAMTDMASDTKILGVPTQIKKNNLFLLQNQRVGKIKGLDTKIVDVGYLRYILTSPQVYSYYKQFGKGGVQINLGKDDILNAEIPLAPLLEQKRIVLKIEELFSELDKGIETLKTAQQQLKVYRQAVLKYAFEGKLTCSDLKENEFPVGWVIKRISDVVIKSTLKSYPDKESDLKFLGMDSIEPNSTKPHFFYKFSDMKSAGNLFISNQVLYGRMRPYLNKVWVADCDGAASGEFIVMTCKELILPLYLLNILHHQDFVKFANSKTSGDRPRISFDEISEFEILIPPIT